ncbi:MAG: hypothetical protein ACOC4G_06080 [Bacillota bacterium]
MIFKLNSQGFITNWYYAGPIKRKYDQDNNISERKIREEVIARPPLMEPLTAGDFREIPQVKDHWKYYASGKNVFVEDYEFYDTLHVIDMYGFTDLVVKGSVEVKARLWSARGTAELWCQGNSVARRENSEAVAANNGIASTVFSLKLDQGKNRIFARVIDLGARNTPLIFGLQLMEKQDQIKISLPDNKNIELIHEADEWLNSVYFNYKGSKGKLQAKNKPPVSVKVNYENEEDIWNKDRDYFTFNTDKYKPTEIYLSLQINNRKLEHKLEIPRFVKIDSLNIDKFERENTDSEYIKLFQEYYEKNNKDQTYLLFQNYLQQKNINFSNIIKEPLAIINRREDCADFVLAAVLRLYLKADLPDAIKKKIKETVLDFRYWSDEKGTDGMCFGTENHSLLFHGCQYIAGNIFSDEYFSRSERIGKEQVQVAKKRIKSWLEERINHGYDEFLSKGYYGITMAALLNVVDFIEEKELAEKASKLLNIMFKQIAEHSFEGVVFGPAGRAYRDQVLYPHKTNTQAMLFYSTPQAKINITDWMVFLLTSKYEVPDNIEELMFSSVKKRYFQGGEQISLKKTNDYFINSLNIPASNSNKKLVSGEKGCQEHLWEVCLDEKTRVFVNHPGSSYEGSKFRPAYWNGNGIIPALKQEENKIFEIFNISEDYPFHFIHAHWPSDQFEQTEIEKKWIFGSKKTSYVGLWFSEEIEDYNDVLMEREKRVYGSKLACFCIVSDNNEFNSFQVFKNYVQSMKPIFNKEKLKLYIKDKEVLRFN